jgi:hypothetical protein
MEILLDTIAFFALQMLNHELLKVVDSTFKCHLYGDFRDPLRPRERNFLRPSRIGAILQVPN